MRPRNRASNATVIRTIAAATILLMSSAFADDRLRDAQAELKVQGFYFGEVDGKTGAESNAAIRRFQIRNGLKVTGELNTETLSALGIGTPAEAAPPAPQPKPGQVNPPPPEMRKPAETPVPEKPGSPVPPRPEPPEAPPAARRPGVAFPDDPAVIPPPTTIPNPVHDEFSTLYHGTPYASAPREVQMDVLRKAQVQLTRHGLYRTVADGIPGRATADALFAYQEQRRLKRTGRLDLPTLAEMNLLPGRSPDAPPLRPFYDPNRRRDRSVDFNSIRRL